MASSPSRGEQIIVYESFADRSPSDSAGSFFWVYMNRTFREDEGEIFLSLSVDRFEVSVLLMMHHH